MQPEFSGNPFAVADYNYSWETIEAQIEEIARLFPDRYKLIYTDEQQQQIILLASLSFSVFGNERVSVLYISKIDNHAATSLLIYEARNYKGDTVSKADYERGRFFIETLSEDMMIVC